VRDNANPRRGEIEEIARLVGGELRDRDDEIRPGSSGTRLSSESGAEVCRGKFLCHHEEVMEGRNDN
jgi:hypothetical protein